MKTKEAKELVGYLLEWQFVCMGVKERNEIKEVRDLSKYSLHDLLKANELVEKSNNRKRKIQSDNQAKGLPSKPITISLTLADRVIAAIYTALNFRPDGQMIALVNGNGVGVVKAKY